MLVFKALVLETKGIVLHRPSLQKKFILSSIDSVALWRPLVTKKRDRKVRRSSTTIYNVCREGIASLQAYKGNYLERSAPLFEAKQIDPLAVAHLEMEYR